MLCFSEERMYPRADGCKAASMTCICVKYNRSEQLSICSHVKHPCFHGLAVSSKIYICFIEEKKFCLAGSAQMVSYLLRVVLPTMFGPSYRN